MRPRTQGLDLREGAVPWYNGGHKSIINKDMGKFDSVRTEDRTLLASAERSATTASESQNNDAARGVIVVLDVTAVSSATNEV